MAPALARDRDFTRFNLLELPQKRVADEKSFGSAASVTWDRLQRLLPIRRTNTFGGAGF